MNVEEFRRSLKEKWLEYYQENRDWLIRLGVWVTCQGQRRPSSSFILATLSILEPRLTQLLPLVVDLSNNPDRIVLSLGLNFNPDEEISRLSDESMRLPASDRPSWPATTQAANPIARQDEECSGIQYQLDSQIDLLHR